MPQIRTDNRQDRSWYCGGSLALLCGACARRAYIVDGVLCLLSDVFACVAFFPPCFLCVCARWTMCVSMSMSLITNDAAYSSTIDSYLHLYLYNSPGCSFCYVLRIFVFLVFSFSSYVTYVWIACCGLRLLFLLRARKPHAKADGHSKHSTDH